MDPLAEAHAIANRGVQCASDGDLKQALVHYDRALERYTSVGTPLDVARTLGNRAAARTGLGQTLEALDDYRRALKTHRDNDDNGRMASTLTNLGQLELGVGDQAAAARHLDEAIALHRESGNDVFAAFTLSIRANLSAAAGEIDRAIEELRTAESQLVVEPVLAAVARGSRALIDASEGRFDAALEGFEAVLPQLEGRFPEPHLLCLMGYGEALERTGDPRTGIAMVQAAERAIEQRDWPLGRAMVLATRARMLVRAGNVKAARDALAEAVAVAETLRAGPGSPLGQDLHKTRALLDL